MNEFQIGEHTYRIKKMNAIELFALRSYLDFDDINKIISSYNYILEKIEVNVKGADWVPVKRGNTYLPVGIENDNVAIPQFVKHFMEYTSSVFTKSEESKTVLE